MHKNNGIFICGTGTDAGKTYISALLLKQLKADGVNAAYYKAAMSGAMQTTGGASVTDCSYAAAFAGLDPSACRVSYRYAAPVSPHLAARLEGMPSPQLERIVQDYQELAAAYDFVVAEGSGGIVCPLRCDSSGVLMQAGVIEALRLDTALVSPCSLGSINAAVLTTAYLRQKQIPLRGVIINRYTGGAMQDDNIHMIELLCESPILTVVKEGQRSMLGFRF
ncbi:MAG: dethiobiotin synthase [Spirochaetaceae bacterium]|jgi:dethiobiotin synthetase|nr:dethiobiotin synthase [Spirochaetaceae bacterium]